MQSDLSDIPQPRIRLNYNSDFLVKSKASKELRKPTDDLPREEVRAVGYKRLNEHQKDETMVAGGEVNAIDTVSPIIDDKHSPQPNIYDQRRESFSRKETARRHLMGYLFTRQPPLKRSYTFIAGERPQTETHLPLLMRSKERDSVPYPRSPNGQTDNHPRHVRIRRTQSYRHSINNSNVPADRSPERVSLGRTKSESKVNLPELINDINNSVKLRTDMCNNSECDNSFLGHINEDITPLADFDLLQGRPKATKFRPITPGMIQKLNKVRVSSRSRTEQWIKALPLDHRGTHIGEEYREHLHGQPKDKNWIYDKH